MSKERFIYHKNYDCITDVETDIGYSNMALESLVGLLNALHQENQILETDGKNQKESKEYWRNKAKELEEENEQLKEELNNLHQENTSLNESQDVLQIDPDYMLLKLLSNLRNNGFCDGCKNKDKPLGWYKERGLSVIHVAFMNQKTKNYPYLFFRPTVRYFRMVGLFFIKTTIFFYIVRTI